MEQVSYALREDSTTIVLLQDAGQRYDNFCQITTFGRNIVKPEFFRNYMYFAPFVGANGKYRGAATTVQMSIEDNGCSPSAEYVAVIDSEVEFRITPQVIQQLSKDYMPAWGVKSYLDYFTDRTSGIILFLRVYKVKQALHPSYLEKGSKGSAQVLKLYDKSENEISLPVDIVGPVISDNKFSYLKDEVIHLLKVENAFIAIYDSTEKGIKSLRERVIADKRIQGTKERWRDSHSFWTFTGSDETDEDFDMAHLDYDSLFREVLDICPGMEKTIGYLTRIKAARMGEYDYLFNKIYNHSEDEEESVNRIFEMSFRTAVKSALNYYKKNNVDYEDAFQEACIGILIAIQKYNDSVVGAFPTYASIWMMQTLGRDLPPYDYTFRIPTYYNERIDKALLALSDVLGPNEYLQMKYEELYQLLLDHTDCNEEEAIRIAYILSPPDSIEEMIYSKDQEEMLGFNNEIMDEFIQEDIIQNARDALSTLKTREREILCYRFGIYGYPELSLENIGQKYGITRERVRQLEERAKQKIIEHYYNSGLISKEKYEANRNPKITFRK